MGRGSLSKELPAALLAALLVVSLLPTGCKMLTYRPRPPKVETVGVDPRGEDPEQAAEPEPDAGEDAPLVADVPSPAPPPAVKVRALEAGDIDLARLIDAGQRAFPDGAKPAARQAFEAGEWAVAVLDADGESALLLFRQYGDVWKVAWRGEPSASSARTAESENPEAPSALMASLNWKLAAPNPEVASAEKAARRFVVREFDADDEDALDARLQAAKEDEDGTWWAAVVVSDGSTPANEGRPRVVYLRKRAGRTSWRVLAAGRRVTPDDIDDMPDDVRQALAQPGQ